MPGWKRSSEEQPPSEKELYCPRNYYLGVLLSSILLPAALYVFIFHVLVDWQNYTQFKNSVATPVTRVLHVELVEQQHREQPLEEVVVKYEYTYKGKLYTGDRASIFSGGERHGSFHSDLYERIKLFQQGDGPLVCYVDPQNPAESVLDRSFRLGSFLMHLILPLGLTGFGLPILFSILKDKKRYFALR
ncbi:DUF3592 domain-containing protein [Gimesia sp.]|uniref:DUF3592 domain-containing protein n=1 Tax=Gimesia sp. TaxID=2024833 RepID=UPI003A8EE26A